MQQKTVLTLADAKQIVAAAEAEAAAHQWNVAIAIVDDGGNLMLLHRMDGTQIASGEICVLKAKTAIGLKRPSKAVEDAVATGRLGMLQMPGVLALEGGVPLIHQSEILGAIGVSGVMSFEDGIVARAGAAVLAP